jgi:hypothetical protein
MTIQAYTGAELNILPPPVTTGGIQSFLDLYRELWIAKPGVNGGNWRKARDVLHASVYRNAALVAPTANSVFPADTVIRDPYGIWVGSPTYAFVLPVAGSVSGAVYPASWWRFAFHWVLQSATSPNYVGCQIFQNGSGVTQDNMIMNQTSAGNCSARTQYMGLGSANDTFQAYYSSSVASLNVYTGPSINTFSCAFMGLFFG